MTEAPTWLNLEYVHDHECSRKDTKVVYRPPCSDGSAYITPPFCIEFGAELTLISKNYG